MRKLMVVMALSCAAVSADAANTPPQKWCSDGFDKPAVLDMSGEKITLKIGERTETFDYGGSVATGMPAFQLGNGTRVEIVTIAEVTNNVVPDKPDVVTLYLFRDRVFYPCP